MVFIRRQSFFNMQEKYKLWDFLSAAALTLLAPALIGVLISPRKLGAN